MFWTAPICSTKMIGEAEISIFFIATVFFDTCLLNFLNIALCFADSVCCYSSSMLLVGAFRPPQKKLRKSHMNGEHIRLFKYFEVNSMDLIYWFLFYCSLCAKFARLSVVCRWCLPPYFTSTCCTPHSHITPYAHQTDSRMEMRIRMSDILCARVLHYCVSFHVCLVWERTRNEPTMRLLPHIIHFYSSDIWYVIRVLIQTVHLQTLCLELGLDIISK